MLRVEGDVQDITMNRALILGSCLSLLAFGGCQKPAPTPPTPPSEEEIERRVQDRVTVELQKQKEAELARREQALTDREQAVSLREKTESNKAPQTAEEEDYEPVENERPEREGIETYEAFREPLSSDGDWFTAPELGYVWRPRVAANPDWRPYTRGQWVSTDRGWTWVSEEPFGWATYHYGRWTILRGVGWVWVPGIEWAPAWVSWRSGDEYVGWAPLPPETDFDERGAVRDEPSLPYAFVTYERFCEPAVVNNIVSVQQNVTIINKTKNITKIVRNRNTKIVINQGPKVSEVASKTKRSIEPLKVEPKSESGRRALVEGKVLRVSQPVTPPARKKKTTEEIAKTPQVAPTAPPSVAAPEKQRQTEPDTTGREQENQRKPREAQTAEGQSEGSRKREKPPTPAPKEKPADPVQEPQQTQAEAIAQEQERQKKIREGQPPSPTRPEDESKKNVPPTVPLPRKQPVPLAEQQQRSQSDAIAQEQERQRKIRAEQAPTFLPTQPNAEGKSEHQTAVLPSASQTTLAQPQTPPAAQRPTTQQEAIAREQERQRKHREAKMPAPPQSAGSAGVPPSSTPAEPRQRPNRSQQSPNAANEAAFREQEARRALIESQRAAKEQQIQEEQRARRQQTREDRRERQNSERQTGSQIQQLPVQPTSASPVGTSQDGNEDRKRRKQRDN